MIGTVGSEEKAELARAHGCDVPILYKRVDFAEQVREITKGAGVAVVYDSIGKDTFMDSLTCLRPIGTMVLFGAASGPVPPVDLGLLAKHGSLFVTRPTLFTYVARREDLVATAQDLSTSSRAEGQDRSQSALCPRGRAVAHTDLEARRTTGSTILLP